MDPRQELIEAAFDGPAENLNAEVRAAVDSVLADLDRGRLRVVEPRSGEFVINAWLKKAILLYFRLHQMQTETVGCFEYRDKLPTKHNLEAQGIRVVPPGVARYGSFLEPGAILMPAYVNVGAYVCANTMVDSWVTVGSCAYIGKDVHLSGGVQIGGVLEPANARPVIVEDGAFIGANAVVVEGVHVSSEAVLGANTVLTASTPIIDVTGETEKILKGYVPPRSVIIPGIRQRAFPAGSYGVPCALLIGQRKASTDRKTSLTAALRDFDVQV